MAAHGFYDGPEGHSASFGVGGETVAVLVGEGAEEEEVPVAGGLEEGQRGLEVIGGVAFGPGVLIEGLDDGVGLGQGGRQGLAETEGENNFAVGQVGGDLADAPLAWVGSQVDLIFGESCRQGADTAGCCGYDRDRILAVEIACVWIQLHDETVSRRV